MNQTTHASEPAVTGTPSEPSLAPTPTPTPTPTRSAEDRGASRRATTDVGALLSFGIAVPLYGLAVWGARMAPANARTILLDRGWPPHATMVLTCLALAILSTKALGLRRQRRAFALDLLPGGERRLGAEGAARLVEHVESIRGFGGARSFLVERVLRVLSQYAAHGDVAEASAANDADAEADAARSRPASAR